MSGIKSRTREFPDVPGLDKEINKVVRNVEKFVGKKVNKLPPVNNVPELSVFHVKQSNGTVKSYLKYGNDYLTQKTDGSIVYWATP